jgi:hypothetical protein
MPPGALNGTRKSADRLTSAERRVVQQHRNPEAVQRWIRSLPYNWERRGCTLRTFRGVVRHGRAHCLEAALAAATILECHGHPPLLLDLESQDLLDHVVFVFRRSGRWGAVAGSRDVGLAGRRPVFRSLRALAMSYYEPYIDQNARIKAFGLADLRALDPYDWRLSSRNVWKVERHLVELPHQPLPTDDVRYRKLRRRFCEFVRTNDPRDTPFKRGRGNWM